MTESSSARTANLLGALSLAVHERLRAATEGTDPLAGSEPATLVTLAHYPGQSIEELRRTLAITHSGAVRLVDRLERAGLVARAPGGPGRTLAIALTRSGRAAAAGVLARLGQRPVLIALATCFAAALVLLVAVAGHPGWAAAVAAVGGLTRPPLESSLRGLWPRLVPRERLDTAYALDSTAHELIWIGGPLLLAALVSFGRPSLPLFACAALTVLGTAVYATSPAVPARGSRRRTDLAGPLAFRGLRAMLLAGGLYGVATGTLTVALPAAAAGFGHPAGTGLLVAVWGLGSLAGGLAYGSRRWRSPVETRAIATLAAFAVALGLLPLATSFPSLLAAMLVLGLPLSPWLGSLSAAVERAVPATMVVEAFTWSFATITVGIACGTAVGGMLIERAGIGAALEIAAATALAGAALAAVIAPRQP